MSLIRRASLKRVLQANASIVTGHATTGSIRSRARQFQNTSEAAVSHSRVRIEGFSVNASELFTIAVNLAGFDARELMLEIHKHAPRRATIKTVEDAMGVIFRRHCERAAMNDVYTTDGRGEEGGCPGYIRVLRNGNVVWYWPTQELANSWIEHAKTNPHRPGTRENVAWDEAFGLLVSGTITHLVKDTETGCIRAYCTSLDQANRFADEENGVALAGEKRCAVEPFDGRSADQLNSRRSQ